MQRRFRISFAAHRATMSRRLIGDQHHQEQSCQTMRLKRAIAAVVLVSAFAAPVAAGTFEDAVDALARGDYAKTLRLIRPLANDGDAAAQYNLGLLYMAGQGVPQDYSDAMIWFQRAAEQGHSVAKLYLGVMYAEGRGVPQDYVRAHMWISLSAAQGEQRAVKTLEMAERWMTPAQINEAQKLARDWKPATQPTPH